jgi:hypothetical protein
LIAWLSVLMTSAGVFLGAPTPCQAMASKLARTRQATEFRAVPANAPRL